MGEPSETLPEFVSASVDAIKLRAAVEQVVSGPEFLRSARMVRFLRYIAEQSLSEQPELSERQLGIAVFDRQADWDPKLDPIVRIEARRLRSKLAKHYESTTLAPDVLLSMPKGSYRLEYKLGRIGAESPEHAESVPHKAISASKKAGTSAWRIWAVVVVIISGMTILTFAHRANIQVSEDHAVQIGSFKVSAGAEGMGDGAALGGMLADQLRAMQSKTRIAWTAAVVEDAWTQETRGSLFVRWKRKLDAIAQADDIFRVAPVKISGVIKKADAQHVEIYLRGNGIEPKTFAGDQLQTLLQQAAEYLYAECQPAAYDVYLTEQGRFDEAIRFSEMHYPRATQLADKTQLLFSWAEALDSLGQSNAAKEKFRSIIDIFPQSWGAYTSLINLYMEEGQAERALELGEDLERATHRGSWIYSHLPAFLFRPTRADTFIPVDQLRNDATSLKRSIEAELQATSGAGIHETGLEPLYAETLIQLHEWRQARLELQAAKSSSASSASDVLEVAVDLARDSHDMESLRNVLNSNRTALLDLEQRKRLNLLDEDLCSLGFAYEEIGDRTAADLLMKGRRASTGCLVWKGDLLSERGDFQSADTAYLEAIGEGSRLPLPHFKYGVFLVARGRLDEARSQFELAHKWGPHWAEPVEALAELDVRLGKLTRALEEFNAASNYAPKWSQLYSEWGKALVKAGDRLGGEEKARLAATF